METSTILILLTAALAISEVLALTKLKSNSVFTLIVNILRWFKEKLNK
jgi:hypothetical protein